VADYCTGVLTWYRNARKHPGYIITFCDAIFLTPEAIQDTVGHIQDSNRDLVLHYVEKSSFDAKDMTTPRTWIEVEDKLYAGSSIYYIRRFGKLAHGLHLIADLQEHRKRPEKFAGIPGLPGMPGLKRRSLRDVEQALSNRLGRGIGLFVSDYPELGMEMDNTVDLAMASKILPMPWKHYNKIMVIMNGKAGGGYQLPPLVRRLLKMRGTKVSAAQALEAIVKAFSACGIRPEIIWTQHAGHATQLARQAAIDGYDVVVAAGGDGTINEVVNGLALSDTALGVIPLGTANLLSSELGIPPDVNLACQVIARGDERRIDTAMVGDRHFTIMAGIGFDAHVVSQVDSKIKSRWGALAYPLVALRELVRYPFRRIRVRTQDGQDLQAFFVFVQNTKLYASGYALSPRSKIDDGSLEVLMFPTRNIFSLIAYLLSKNKSRHCIKMEGVTSLEISSSHAIQIDGDYACRGPATIRVAPASLKVLADDRICA
jgi:YegS/Rv2252/BmrU family lipid kinase